MSPRFRHTVTSIVLITAFSGILRAQAFLPETRQGKAVREYITTFNSGDEAMMREFFLTHISKQGLAERPAEARVERMRMFRSEAKSLTLLKVLDTSATSLTATAKTANGETLTLTFTFDATPEHTLASIRVEMGEQQVLSGPPLRKKEFLDSVERAIEKAVREDRFSGSVLIAHGNSVVFKKAYGHADKRFSVPNRTDTKFNLGSINKFFTQMAIGQLAQTGKVAFDKPFITYLPNYPNKAVAEKVTVEQLINMTSGMGDFFGEKFANTPKDKIRTLKDYLQLFVNDTLLFTPGTQRRYSNAGYIVLGLIVEQISGQDYYSYAREQIFKPAGMMNTDWFTSDAVTPNLATGYTHPDREEKIWVSNIHTLPGRGSPAGGGYSTLDDLHGFVRALLGGRLLNPHYSEWMLTNTLPKTAPSLPLNRGNIAIAGGAPGMNAVVEVDAESGNVVIVLANYHPPAAQAVSRAIRNLVGRTKW